MRRPNSVICGPKFTIFFIERGRGLSAVIPILNISIRSGCSKLKLYNVCILPIMLYGSECWALSKADVRKIDALDQWCLRRILDIRWYHRVSNWEVRRLTEQLLLTSKTFGDVSPTATKNAPNFGPKTHAVWTPDQNG